MKIVILLVFLFLSLTYAESPTATHNYESTLENGKPECKLVDYGVETEIELKDKILSYFASTDGRYVYFISGNRNYRLTLSDKKIIEIPGIIDPVPSPDGAFLTVPMYSHPEIYQKNTQAGAQQNRALLPNASDFSIQELDDKYVQTQPASTVTGLGVFKMGDLEKEGVKANYTLDKTMIGSYQSIGVFNKTHKPGMFMSFFGAKTTSTKVYRVITSLGAQEYTYENGQLRTLPAIQGLCTEIADHENQSYKNTEANIFTLPMISKDGQYISVYNNKTYSTQIYKFDADTSKCSLVLDLDYPTGKVDFSYDGNQIAFHVDNYGMSGQQFENLGQDRSKDLVVLQLTKDKDGVINGLSSSARLTAHTELGYGTYYPRWTPDNKIIAIRQNGNKFSILKIDPTQVPKSPYTKTKEVTKKDHIDFLLGALWEEYCRVPTANYRIPTFMQAAMYTDSLDPDSCVALVKNQFEKYKAELIKSVAKLKGFKEEIAANLTAEDLLAACPKKHSTQTLVKSSVAQDVNAGVLLQNQQTARRLLNNYCISCHGDPQYPQLRSFKEGQEFPADLVDNMILKISLHQMPPPPKQINNDDYSAFIRSLSFNSGYSRAIENGKKSTTSK